MATKKISWDRTETHLVLLQDGKVHAQWRLENLPKDDSINDSPERTFMNLVRINSNFGNPSIVVDED